MGYLRRFLSELRRRRVYNVALVYAAVAFVVWQVADIALPSLGLPESAVALVLVLTLLGFPVALVLAWAYELRPEESAPSSSPTAPPPAASVAVLPFENMGAGQEDACFADGIAEELTHALGRVPTLRVAARTSAFSFRAERLDVREIGARLGVAHVVEGSVRRSGDRLRVTAQLIDARGGFHLWSGRYEREWADVFLVQDEIVAAVVEHLLPLLGGDRVQAPRVAARTEDLDAYEVFLRGRHALRAFDGASLENAVALFERAVEIDPDFAVAHAALAEALTTQALGFQRGTRGELLPRAQAAAGRALALNPHLPEAHLARALSRIYHDWAFADGLREIEMALELNPSMADAHRWAEFYWTYVARDHDRAMASLEAARALDPMDPRLPYREGTVAYIFGRYDRAERFWREALDRQPDSGLSIIGLADTLVRRGATDEAVQVARRAAVDGSVPDALLGVSGCVLALGGADAEARVRLGVLESRRAEGYASPFWCAVVHAALGESDRAFALLEEAFAERDGALLFLSVTPRIPGLQDDSRFADLIRRMGLVSLLPLIPGAPPD